MSTRLLLLLFGRGGMRFEGSVGEDINLAFVISFGTVDVVYSEPKYYGLLFCRVLSLV